MLSIAVLRGGPSAEYEISLKSGEQVIKNLRDDKYAVQDILIDKNAVWHKNGFPVNPHKVLHNVDIVFNALHGEYGEDGTVQKIVEEHGVPYTGSGVFASAISMNKAKTKDFIGTVEGVENHSQITLYPDKIYDLDKVSKEVFSHFPAPYVLKPLRGGSSIDVFVVRTIKDLPSILEDLLRKGPVIVEEYKRGKEVTCGVVESLRGEDIYTLPPVEIRLPEGKEILDYDTKSNSEELKKCTFCPGNLSEEEKLIIQNAAKEAHHRLGLKHYSRSDFIISPRGVYLLEVNALPELTPTSFLVESAESVGIPFNNLLEHIVDLTYR